MRRSRSCAQNFAAVCEGLEAESNTAVSERRLSDAASLSTMLGSFRSMTGDEEAALKAFRQAEQLEPGDAHRRLSTARHLFVRMKRDEEAARKIDEVLGDPQLDDAARHEALALLGRLALHDSRLMDAAETIRRRSREGRPRMT